MRVVVFMLAVVAVSGCAIGRRPDRSRFFTLSPVAEPVVAHPSGLVVGLGPVMLPAYLDRPQLVRRQGEERLDLDELERWGEPLHDGLLRVLALDLALHAGTARVVRHPWVPSTPLDAVVTVDVNRFERHGDAVELDARWTVGPRAGARVAQAFAWREPLAGDDGAATVGAMNRALDALSRAIAEAVRPMRP